VYTREGISNLRIYVTVMSPRGIGALQADLPGEGLETTGSGTRTGSGLHKRKKREGHNCLRTKEFPL